MKQFLEEIFKVSRVFLKLKLKLFNPYNSNVVKDFQDIEFIDTLKNSLIKFQ